MSSRITLLSKRNTACFLFAAGIMSSPVFAQTSKFRDLSVNQTPIAMVGEEGDGMPTSDIRVSAWVDRRDATYAPGDQLSVQVRTNRDAFITVLDIGTSGRATVIYPNKFQQSQRVRAFEVVQIPPEDSRIRITVGGPLGREVIKVFATDRPMEYFDLQRMTQQGSYYSLNGDARSIARDIAVELKEKMNGDYGVSTQVVNIVDRSASYANPSEGPGPGIQNAGSGSPDQLFQLAENQFYDGGGTGSAEAFRNYTRAAEAGHVLAMVRLGSILEQGMDGPPDVEQAVSWYRRAADLGSPQAMVKLARLFSDGRGVRRSFDLAVEWLTKAAEAGDGVAMARLAKAYDDGKMLAPDAQKAARYVLNAVRAGAWSVQNDMPEFSLPTREQVQRLLTQEGFYRGPIDGVLGDATRSALTDYARSA